MPIRRTTAANRGSARTGSQAWSTLSNDNPVIVLVGRSLQKGQGFLTIADLCMQAGDVEGGNKPLLGQLLQVTKLRPCHRHLSLLILGFSRGARERLPCILIAV